MSQEAAQAFVERVNDDETLRDQLIAAGDNDSRLRMAQEAGFDVTADDLAELRAQVGVDELSEEDLQKVAGGASTTEVATAVGTAVSFVTAVAALV